MYFVLLLTFCAVVFFNVIGVDNAQKATVASLTVCLLVFTVSASSYDTAHKIATKKHYAESSERYLKKHNYPSTFVACGDRISGQQEAIGYLEKWRTNLSSGEYTLVDIGELAVLHCIAGRAPLIDAVQELWSSRYEIEPTNEEHESFNGPCAVKVQTRLIKKVLEEYDAQKESGEGTQ